ncbi:MAG: CDP-alcohol phosphatidyltransferase family protein [Gammaproteobacteria bacterium]
MNPKNSRRPLKSREIAFFADLAKELCRRGASPNQISVASLLFSVCAGVSLLLTPGAQGASSWLLPVLAAAFIQLRLLCNLLDGMVAVEGGKGTPSGELYNDIPDRLADAVILISAGYAIPVVSWGGTLGWCAALFAVMTAYVRTLAASIGAPVDFRGPMAKQHRMAVMTAACLATAAEGFFWTQGYVLAFALAVIVAGTLLTLVRRIRAAYLYLESHVR